MHRIALSLYVNNLKLPQLPPMSLLANCYPPSLRCAYLLVNGLTAKLQLGYFLLQLLGLFAALLFLLLFLQQLTLQVADFLGSLAALTL